MKIPLGRVRVFLHPHHIIREGGPARNAEFIIIGCSTTSMTTSMSISRVPVRETICVREVVDTGPCGFGHDTHIGVAVV